MNPRSALVSILPQMGARWRIFHLSEHSARSIAQVVSNLPDDWFRPAQADHDADAGGITAPRATPGGGAAGSERKAERQISSGLPEEPSEITIDPGTTGRLSLGDADGEGPVVVVGHTAPLRAGFARHQIRWSWLLLAAVICLVIGLALGITVRGHTSQHEPASPVAATRMATTGGAGSQSEG